MNTVIHLHDTDASRVDIIGHGDRSCVSIKLGVDLIVYPPSFGEANAAATERLGNLLIDAAMRLREQLATDNVEVNL